VRIVGVYGTKEAALDGAAVAAAFAVRDGDGVQINVPGAVELSEAEIVDSRPTKWTTDANYVAENSAASMPLR
jgi:hypothetical protein